MLGFNGGLMGVRKVPTAGSASGLWSPNEQSVAKRAGIWPQVQELDPYFANVSLLLHMDGANGSTTFTDSSLDARTVTRYGNSVISTAQSKFGGASVYFDNTGATGLQCSATSVYTFGTTDFTIEGWYYVISPTGQRALFDFGSYVDGVYADFDGSGNVRVVIKNNFNSFSSTQFPLNQWVHFAVTRSGTTARAWVNGVSNLSFSNTSNITGLLTEMAIGTTAGASGTYGSMTGYVDDFRITKGISRYNATFAPPTAPFPNA